MYLAYKMESIIDMLTNETTVCRAQNTVFTKIDEQVVMMDIEQGVYYGLNPVAARTWELIENPATIKEICQQLIQEFEVSLEVCQEHIISFLDELVEKNIVVVKGE